MNINCCVPPTILSAPPAPTPKAAPEKALPTDGKSITVCYDYAYYKGTGQFPKPPAGAHYLGAKALEDDASVKSKEVFKNAKEASGHISPGDWLVTTDGHAGFVNANGRVDHFHQVFGKSGTPYTQADPDHTLPGWEDGHGGLLLNDSLDHFLNSGFRTDPNQVLKVLHRVPIR